MKKYFLLSLALLSVHSSLYAQDCTGVAQWSSTATYTTANAKVVHLGILYHNNFWTNNQAPATNNGSNGSGQPWTSEGTCLVGTDGSGNTNTGSMNWSVGGNAIADGNFVGTTNNKALVLKANNFEGLFVNPEKGSISIGKALYPFYYKFEVNGGLTAFSGPNQVNQNNLMTLYSGNQSTAKYGQGFRHYIGFSHGLYANGEEYGVMNTYEYNSGNGVGAGKHLLIQNTNEGNLGIGVMTTAPAEKVAVNGNVQIGVNAPAYASEGKRLYFGAAFDNTDPVYLARFNTASDRTTLRMCLGDNSDNLDLLEIGSMTTGSNTWIPAVRIGANGTLVAKEVCVNLNLGWCDYVFEEDYKLMSLNELKKFINKYHHLPEIPSANEMEKTGLNLNNIVTLQMKKIEELTLYTIEQDQKIETMEERLKKLEALISKKK